MAYKYPELSVRNPPWVITNSETMALSINSLYKVLFGEVGDRGRTVVSKLNRIENQRFLLQGNWMRSYKSALPTATDRKILQDVN